jgi:acyl carrier protein
MEEFIDYFKEYVELDIDVKPTDKFRDYSEWDSLAALSVTAIAHDKYKVNLMAEDLRSCTTVADIYDLILKKRR